MITYLTIAKVEGKKSRSLSSKGTRIRGPIKRVSFPRDGILDRYSRIETKMSVIIKTAVPRIFPRDENDEGEEQRKWKGKICAANNENRTRIEAPSRERAMPLRKGNKLKSYENSGEMRERKSC